MRTILILAANPKGTNRLRLDEEVSRIEQALERAKKRHQFKVVAKWAVTDDALRRALLDNEPEVVHFAGHGTGGGNGGTGRDFGHAEEVDTGGLAFDDGLGNAQFLAGGALATLFKLCSDSVKCVVLNACYSAAQANVITKHIDFVVGMKRAIGDPAAIKFAVGFYDALFAGRDFEKAFEFGCNAIDLKRIPEHLTPILKKKNGSAVTGTKSAHAENAKSSRTISGRIGATRKTVKAKATPPSASTSKATGLIRLFYSYSHKDEKLRDKLEEALTLLKRQGLVAGWHDRRIGAGDEWKGAIDRNLDESEVILLLVSASFIASDYCWDVEVKRAITRHDRGEAKVIPVILRSCDWQASPFGKLQGLPKDGKPVMTWANKDTAWTDVAKGIRLAVNAIIENPPNPPRRVVRKAGAGESLHLNLVASNPIEGPDLRDVVHLPSRDGDERRKEIQKRIENEINSLVEEDRNLITKSLAKALFDASDPRLAHDSKNLTKDVAARLAFEQSEYQLTECVHLFKEWKRKRKTAIADAIHEILKLILPLEIDERLLDYVWGQVNDQKMVLIDVPVERHQTADVVLSGIERKPPSFERKLAEVRSKALVCELPPPGKQSQSSMALAILKSLCEGLVLPESVDDKLPVKVQIENVTKVLQGILDTLKGGAARGRRPYCILKRFETPEDRAIFQEAIEAIDTVRLGLLFVELAKGGQSGFVTKEVYLLKLLNDWFDDV